jgi:hypothetical protein
LTNIAPEGVLVHKANTFGIYPMQNNAPKEAAFFIKKKPQFNYLLKPDIHTQRDCFGLWQEEE